jgi:hypothetical protein
MVSGQKPGLFSSPVYTSLINTTVTDPQLSVAVMVEGSGSVMSLGVFTLKFVQVIVGGVLSTTWMVCGAVTKLPAASVARHVRVIV